MGRQQQSGTAVNEDYPLFSSKSTNINTTTSATTKVISPLLVDKSHQYYYCENNCGDSAADSTSSCYSSCDQKEEFDHNNYHYVIRKLVPTEPYWKRVANTLDKNKKSIMMGCVLFVLVSLFIVSTVFFVKSVLMNNIVLLSICAIMSLLAILIISILMIIWLTKYGKSNN